MKIILAPDKFKSCMTAEKFCEIVSREFRKAIPQAEIIALPMADGGEGTLNAILNATGGTKYKIEVTGPLENKRVTAEYGIFNNGKSAVFEMASASGMALLKRTELNPLKATSYGTGEVIKAILDRGVEDITLGIGGSATVDGGAGMAQALGYRLLDKDGNELEKGGGALKRLSAIDTASADKRIFKTTFRTACDVTSPLLGEKGAAYVFAPQKGATPEMVETLEQSLATLADVWMKSGMTQSVAHPGDGAAGGLGAGLRAFCKAKTVNGAQLVMEKARFSEYLKDASLVITGEGRTDSQTDAGKLCSQIADEAHKHGVEVMLLAGAITGAGNLFDYMFSISTGHTDIDEALASGEKDLAFTAANIASLLAKTL